LLSRKAPRLPYSFPISPVARPSQSALQTKLAISAPGDPAEKEADSIADRVMRMPNSVDAVHRKGSTQVGPTATTALSAVNEVLRSPGQPLDPATRAFMEPRFGQDFSSVRVHTDARASQSARTIHAQAYSVGNDVVLDKRHYEPGSDAGRRLLAHELTHVLQPKSSPVVQRKSEVGDALESMLALLILYASDDLESEILKGILASSRPVSLRGNDKDQEAELRAHIAKRKGIVDFCGKE